MSDKDKYLHIVSLDIPIPANYGGAIDIYFKLRALHAIGVRVIFHCFSYGGRTKASELNDICEKVFYYPRKKMINKLLDKTPAIVCSRSSEKLIERLAADDYPILFEGLHSCFYLNDKRIKHKRKIVRTHNIEHDYYLNLAKIEKKKHLKLYYSQEAIKLKKFEKNLKYCDAIAAISKNDYLHFQRKKYAAVKVISAFHSYEKVNIKDGIGDYALYHGSLEVGENNNAAIYLIEEVFSKTDYPLYIAGNNPSKELKQLVAATENVHLFENIGAADIDNLIQQAQINILPTFQATGIKLKLLAALYIGRHCLVNTPMIKDTGLEDLCIVEDEAEKMLHQIDILKNNSFSDISLRKQRLENSDFSNKENVYKLSSLLFSEE